MLSNYRVALQCLYIIDYDDTNGIDLDQTPADVAIFVVPFKCHVIFAGLLVTEPCGGATTTPVVAFDRRVTAGSDTGRGAADIANLVLSTTAAGKLMYDLVAKGTVLNPGDEIVVQLVTMADGTGAAGHGRPVLVVEPDDETMANITDMVLTA